MASRNSKCRMIYWKISYSKQLARCTIFSKLLFTWLVPNTDDLGRMEGEPEILKGMIFPYDEAISVEMIRDALQELVKEKLIIWYQVDDNYYIQFPNFQKYQKLRSDRTYKSDYPEPSETAAIDTTCHDIPRHDIQNLREEKRSEEKKKRSEEKKDYSLEIENFRQRYSDETLKLIEEYFEVLRTTRVSGKISDSVILQVYKEMNKHPSIVVGYACKTVVDNPKLHDKKENYFYGIMRNTRTTEAEEKLNGRKNEQEETTRGGNLKIWD